MADNQTELPTTVVLPPQTALQLSGQSLQQVTAALGAQPMLLVIVLLNMMFAGVAGYFMLQLEQYRAENLGNLIELVRACVLETAPLKSNEARRSEELEKMIEQNEKEIERLRSTRPPPP